MGERRGRPGQVAGPLPDNRDTQDKQPCTHPFIPKGNLERPINLPVIGLWEEARVPGENPHMHRENMQSLQKDPRPGVEPRTILLQGNSTTNCATMQPSLENPQICELV
ncbi:hypothetical protein GOODEAATRI_000587 [Goodea atripinnis]|uniref:Prolactin receptor n=1 Tax=Goodea atripinnis TaxID=208336 RepID=A0ABV0NHY5_9TELE